MRQIVECVANFSEGRRVDVVDRIVEAIAGVRGVLILGVESDVDHHRSVVSFAGAPAAAADAAFAGICRAAELIDMERHRGQHPRVGAADVIPFIPIQNLNMEDCVRLAEGLGERVAAALDLPVFLYEKAARQPMNRSLADIRRGGYEGLRESLVSGAPPQPDFGPRRLGKAGACIIGAREALIALNVYLTTVDVGVARRVARAVRHSSGGLPHVKALGLLVKGRAQVSMNLSDYRQTPLHRVIEAVRCEAERCGVGIESAELIGLVPQEALLWAAAEYMQMDNFGLERVLEHRLRMMK